MATPPPTTTTATKAALVELRYDDLLAHKDLSAQIEAAFGEHGLGLLTVSGVPGLQAKRRALLPLARHFAALPDPVKHKYEHATSFYSFGWSHGKEKLQGGKPDVLKGSFYANPLHDAPTTDAALIDKYPAFVHPNIWPTADLPALEPAFKALGQLIVEVGTLVAWQCDAYVHRRCPGYPPHKLERIVRDSRVCKGRLLHYFPYIVDKKEEGGGGQEEVSTYCGWHNDHGSLTGLTPAMYLDAEGTEVALTPPIHHQEEQEEDQGGLYALSRAGDLVKVMIPPTHLAFQIGETAQVHSGGLLRATPHAVKGSTRTGPHVTRETFAVFMEPEWDEPMTVPAGRTVAETCAHQVLAARKGVQVPSLESRWTPEGMDFAGFTEKTLGSYY